jgi:ribonuclease VapC
VGSRVLDASAVLAVLFGEVGPRDALRHLAGGCVSAVNQAEILTRAAERGGSLEAARREVDRYRLRLVPFDADLAAVTASLRPATRPHGLSLGDRACLATAIRLGVPVVTADRAWADLDLGVAVEVIR